MILINSESEQNIIHITRNFSENDGSFSLELTSTSTKKQYNYEVIDESECATFYKFNIDARAIPNGFYEYRLCSRNGTIANGLMRVGLVINDDRTIENNETNKFYNDGE